MQWSDLEIFLAVVRQGSLGAAARVLGQSQPTMGRRIRALEASLGQQLFQRTGEGFILTAEGEAVAAHAERMEEEALAIKRRLDGTQRLEGLLRVTCSDWFGLHILTPVVAQLGAREPGIVVEMLTDARLYSLARREADVAFRIRPFDEPDVITRKLAHIRYGVYQQRGMPQPAADGVNTRLVTMDTNFNGMPDAVWLRQHLPCATIAARSNNRSVQASLCARGLGLAVLPEPLALATPDLERVDLGEDPPGRDTWIGYHHDLRRQARLRALLDLFA